MTSVWLVPGTLASFMPVWMVPRSNTERSTPTALPRPPLSDTPPSTTAVRTNRIEPSALSPRADWYWLTHTNPASPDSPPASA
jgi:hypothetical protein